MSPGRSMNVPSKAASNISTTGPRDPPALQASLDRSSRRLETRSDPAAGTPRPWWSGARADRVCDAKMAGGRGPLPFLCLPPSNAGGRQRYGKEG